MLDLRGISFTYPYSTGGVHDVSLTIRPGELVTIVGPNGSGKSTLLKLIARILHPVAGSLRLDGREVEQIPAREYARRIGYLPQESESAFPIRALDVVVTGRAPYLGRFQWESERDVEAAREALRLCDAAHLGDRLLDEMSGGERKRVFLARVLAGTPELVLLDEPLASLDLAHVEALARLLRRLVDDDGRGVVFVAHDFNWASAFSDRVIAMGEGRVVADGAPAEVFTPDLMLRVFGVKAEILRGSGGVGWIVPTVKRGS